MDYGIAAKQRQIMSDLEPDKTRLANKTSTSPVTEPIVGAVKQPGYLPGGGPVEQAPEVAIPVNYGAAPKVYDEGGKVNIMNKAADYAQNLYEQAKALLTPEDSEADSLKAKQENINQVAPQPAAPVAPAQTQATPSPVELSGPTAYGSRPGEKRIDTTEMTKPLGQGQSSTPQPYKMQGSKLYDEGGEVDLDGDGENDHEKALLSNGERVLTPEEAAEYEKEHPEVKKDGREGRTVTEEGAPTDFGGRVIPQTNPPTIPVDSDSHPSDTDVLPRDIQGNIQNAPMQTPPGDISNPPTANVIPQMGRPIISTQEANGAEPQPYGGEVKQPSYQPGKEPAPAALDEHEIMKKALEQKKGEAAMKGDLLGLGAAIIGEKATEPKPVYGGPMAAGAEQPKPGEPVPTGKAAYEQKMSYYQKAYQDALDDFSPEGKERAGNIKEAMLNYERTHPYGSPESERPGGFGKIEHALADVGNVAGAAVAPGVEAAIPQSLLGRQVQRAQAQEESATGSKEALEGAQTEMAKVETAIKKLGAPQELTGDQNVRTNTGTGKRERAYKYLDGTVRWVPEGASPIDPQFYTPPKFDLFSGPKPQIGAQPAQLAPGTPTNITGVTTEGNTAAAAAAAATPPALQGGAPQYIYGEKPDAEHMPASRAELGTLDASIKAMPSLNDDQRKSLAFPPGYAPTVADVKDRLGILEKMQNAQRQVSQDKFNDEMKKVVLQNQELMMQQRLEDEKLKHDQLFANNAATADSGYASLAAQEVYNDAMKTWYKSPSYVKDVVLVTNLLDEAKNQSGGFSSLGSDAGIGALLGGPEGAMVGGAVGLISQTLRGPAEAALETLKKNGISNEGYQAMQAYFNSIPGRLNFETSVMGVKATAMRMREVMRSLMNTVPSPNTPESAWDNSFNLYYKPMKNLTDRKVKNLDLPQGYQKPTREGMGYPAAPKIENPRPKGATHAGVSTIDGKEYYLDAQGKKLGLRYKESE